MDGHRRGIRLRMVLIYDAVLVGRGRIELPTNGLKVSTKQKVISKQRESMAAKSNIKSMS